MIQLEAKRRHHDDVGQLLPLGAPLATAGTASSASPRRSSSSLAQGGEVVEQVPQDEARLGLEERAAGWVRMNSNE